MTVPVSGLKPFTLSGNELAERKILEIANGIRDYLVDSIHPIVIVISGSFGRGEGSVQIKDGEVTIVSDFEIGIFHRNWLVKRHFCRLAAELTKKYSVDITLNFFLTRRFTKGVPTNWSLRRHVLTIDQYELTNSARVIYGPDLRLGGPQARAEDIAMWDGNRLLFNRMAELIEELLRYDKSLPLPLEKAITKLLIACGDNALLMKKRYHFSYRERMERFKNMIASPEFPFQTLGKEDKILILRAYHAKLFCETYGEFSESSLLRTLTIAHEVLDYVIKNDLSVDMGDFTGISEKFRKSIKGSERFLRYSAHPVINNLVTALKNKGNIRPYGLRDLFDVLAIPVKVFAEIPNFLLDECAEFLKNGAADELRTDPSLKDKGEVILDCWKRFCQ